MSSQPQKCPAVAALTIAEARDLNARPAPAFDADTRSATCDFTVHPAGTPHAFCAQAHDDGTGGLALWWLVWDGAGLRELRTAPGCRQIVGGETCLFIRGHPGACDG